MRVQVRKGIKELVCPKHDPAQRKRLTIGLDPLCKVITGDVFHYKELLIVLAEMVTYLWKHRMAQASQHPGLTFEGASEILVTCKKGALQGDCTAEALIHSEVDFPHPA